MQELKNTYTKFELIIIHFQYLRIFKNITSR
jgi:hypothetical protein